MVEYYCYGQVSAGVQVGDEESQETHWGPLLDREGMAGEINNWQSNNGAKDAKKL